MISTPMPFNARNSNTAAPLHQVLTHVIHGLLGCRKSEERIAPQRLVGCAWDQKWGVGQCCGYSPLLVPTRGCERRGVSACLRGAFAHFFAEANAPTVCRYDTSKWRPVPTQHILPWPAAIVCARLRGRHRTVTTPRGATGISPARLRHGLAQRFARGVA